MRFIKKDDCYLDNETGLEWTLDNYGPMTWDDAVDCCKSLGGGWRLPTIEELLTLVDFTKSDPSTKLPNHESSYYWSSTILASDPNDAWSIYFGDGLVSYIDKVGHEYVRCVKGETR